MVRLDSDDFRRLVAHCPAMLWRANFSAERDYFNPAWLTFTGRALEQELSDGWLQSVHPRDLSACRARYLDHAARRQPFVLEYRLRRCDGAYRAVLDRAVPYLDAAGAFAGWVGTVVDVDELLDGEEPYGAHDFFEMSLDNLCVAGFDGYLKRINPSWTRTLGWSAQELMSKPSLEFVHPDDRAATLAGRARLREGLELGPLVNRYLCKDGSYRWFEWRSVANADRELVYAAARDITEQKATEERLTQAKEMQATLQRQLIFADRMASVGTLAAGVAHEINNPLAFVVANIELILEGLERLGGEGSPQLAELVNMARDVQGGAERIRKIVRGLKTFSRAEGEERLAVIDVKSVLELAINMTFNEFRHRAKLIREYGEVPLVDADEARLGQVFINLLVNAAQAIPEADATANEIRVVTSTDAAGRAVIEIRDTGAGIPERILERIFDPFFTTKPIGIGTGLGLSICHNIVTSMGGEISVVSAEGRGTTFRVVLPHSLAPARVVASVPVSAATGSARHASVLVVDDEPAIGTTLRRVLREHDVTAVTTAHEALDLLQSGKRFDVIFSDLMMPEMSGMDFFHELTRRFPETVARVVFISGGAFTPNAAAFLETVKNECLDKPFDARIVHDVVRRYGR